MSEWSKLKCPSKQVRRTGINERAKFLLESFFSRPRTLEWWVWDTSVSATQKLLVLPLLLILAFGTLPFSHASEDLVKNGGFETGDFTGWTATNSKDYRGLANSGKYAARIGTETIEGRIAQTVSIPPKSIAKFTAWYRVEKGSSLTVILSKSDGSVIQQWSVTNVTPWTSMTYDLDVSYAGQSVTIEFVGVGYRETTSGIRHYDWECDPSGANCHLTPVEYEIHKDYWPYVDDVSLTYEVVVYETALAVSGLPEELSTKVLVDASQLSTIAGGQSKILPFKIGETHSISVETYVYKNNGIRYYCASEPVTVNTDNSITFSYKPQYYLSVISPYGDGAGSGWYDAGAIGAFSVDSRVPGPTGVDYLLIPWKATYSFDHWTQDSSSTKSSDSITMDGPKTVTAAWTSQKESDYTPLLAVVGLSVGGIAGAYLFITRRKRARDRRSHKRKRSGEVRRMTPH